MEAVTTDIQNGRTVGLITFFPSQPLGLQKFSTVFEGKFGNLDVAVKKIPIEVWDGQKENRGEKKEDDILCKLDHENIIRFCYTITTEDFRFIAFEFCQYNLVQWRNEFKTVNWDPDEKRLLLHQACNGLAYLHKNNIIHRDVKPENILVNKISEESIKISGKSQFQVKICDFGISRVTKDGRSSYSQNTGSGTTIWMAPEVLRAFKNQAKDGDKLSKASDIFAFGCVAFWLLTDGNHPFVDGRLEHLTIENNIAGQYKQCINLSHMKIQHVGASRLILQMIAEDPKDRPPAAAVLEHHFFFKKSDSLEFLKSVSKATENGVPTSFKIRFAEILNAQYEHWEDHFDPDGKAYIRKHIWRKPYNEYDVMDLVRFLRNASIGYMSTPVIINIDYFEFDDQYLDEILGKYPFIIDDVWLVFQTMKDYNILKKFYKTDYEFRISPKCYEKDQIKGFIESKCTSKSKLKPSNTSSRYETEQPYAQESAQRSTSYFDFKSSNCDQSEVKPARNPVAGTSASTRYSPYELCNRPERNSKTLAPTSCYHNWDNNIFDEGSFDPLSDFKKNVKVYSSYKKIPVPMITADQLSSAAAAAAALPNRAECRIV